MSDEARIAGAIEAAAWSDMFAAMPAPMRERTGARVVEAGGATVLLAPGVPTPFFNRAIGLGAASEATADDVDEILAAFERVPAFLVHTCVATRGREIAESRLRARGLVHFASRPTWAKFLRDAAPPPDVQSDLRLEPAPTGRALELGHVLAAAHGMPPTMAAWIAELVGRPRWHSYALYDGAAIVGGGVAWVRGAHAWLGLGGTASTHRRRGGQRALMARRVRDACALGATLIATETGEAVRDEPNPSLANMRWCGFRHVASRVNWTRPSS